MGNFTDPIKAGFGRYLAGFHQQLMGDTLGVREFAARPFGKAAVWAPGRMADSVEEMLEAWRKNDTSQATQPKVYLPVMIAALSKDFTPAPGDFVMNRGDWIDVMIPSDTEGRVFKMRSVTRDVRAVVLIAAADEPTASSLALQLQAYCSEMFNRRFAAHYPLAGLDEKWPVSLEVPDIMTVPVLTEQKNITMMTAEFTLRATIPMLKAPLASQPNDGKGSGNTDNPFASLYNPNGYLVVVEARGANYPPHPDAAAVGGWRVGGNAAPPGAPPESILHDGSAVLFDGHYLVWSADGNQPPPGTPPGAILLDNSAVLFDDNYLVFM